MSAILIKHFFLKLWMFLQKYSKNLGESFFVCNKSKTKALFQNCWHIFLDIEKNLAKTKLQTNLIWFRTVGALRSPEGISKLDTVWEQFAWQILKQFFMKNVKWQYLEYELWGNKGSCWIVGNIVSLISCF